MPTVDIIIKNGTVVDGSGAPAFSADVGITGDRIALIGPNPNARAGRVIDADGLVVAPGFIDMMGQSEYHLLVDPRGMSKIMQGVTTEITGEGASVAPRYGPAAEKPRDWLRTYGIEVDWVTIPEYFSRLERQGIGLNLGTYVGAAQLRGCVVGLDDRPPTEIELAKMKWIAGEAMKDGAFGLSSALQYVPGSYASTEELIALAQAVVPYGGIYATHQRSEGDRLDESFDEVLTIAQRAQISVEIFHLKAAYRRNWGKMPGVLERIVAAREAGLDITADVYPYAAASTGLANCLPAWARAGGDDAMQARLADEPTRGRIRKEINANEPGWENLFVGSGGADGIQISAVANASLNHFLG
ncbi:MAG: D-aminoacylase, partial [Pyrinomonadaceae bacterium]